MSRRDPVSAMCDVRESRKLKINTQNCASTIERNIYGSIESNATTYIFMMLDKQFQYFRNRLIM